MKKIYVFPLISNDILLSVKSEFNPRNGDGNFLALLPNPIGGNSDGREALVTVQAEASEETRGKVVVNSIVGPGPFYRSVDDRNEYCFYLSLDCTYNPGAVLTAAQEESIATANEEWDDDVSRRCGGRCRAAQRQKCDYCSYLDRNKDGLTLLENTGEVAKLNILSVTSTSANEAAISALSNVQGISRCAAISDQFINSHTMLAIRKLAAGIRFFQTVTFVKTKVVAALAHVESRQMRPHAPLVQPAIVEFNASKAALTVSSAAVKNFVAHPCPALQTTMEDILKDVAEIIAIHHILVGYVDRSKLDKNSFPTARANRSQFVIDLVIVLDNLVGVESKLLYS